MSRHSGGAPDGTRSSALWGTGNRGGDSRANALWGKGGRGLLAVLTVLFVTTIPLAQASRNPDPSTYLDPLLEAKAHETPNALVKVIIQSNDGTSGAENAYQAAGNGDAYSSSESVNRRLRLVGSVSATMKARRVLVLARRPGLTITSDARIKLDTNPSSNQVWPTAEGLRPLWSDTEQYRSATPTIAIVDSGIDKNRVDFDGGARVEATRFGEIGTWFVIVGAAMTVLGFLLPWSRVVIGSRSLGGYLDTWGLASPTHVVVLLGALAILALGIMRTSVPVWLWAGVLALALGGLLLGLTWPYQFGPLGADVGAIVVGLGGLALIIGGGVTSWATRHVEVEPAV
jgi:hypothetical protein